MSLQEYYEDSYRMERGLSPRDFKDEVLRACKDLCAYVEESKSRFLTNRDWQGLRVLELGSGRGGPRCMSCPISRDPLDTDPS